MSASGDQSGSKQIEVALLGSVPASSASFGPIFILGAPRTGSTILYQSMIAGFELPFICNMTNAFYPTTPIVGLSVQRSWVNYDQIKSDSRFGKVDGLLQPSEGSAVMKTWFGGGHPSEIVSANLLPGAGPHMTATMRASYFIHKRPLVIKNAWNCFRVAALAELLPQAAFIWIRRDLEHCASSDLAARYVTKGVATDWNSATPRNIEELLRRPPTEQVVENQAEFARAIASGLAGVEDGRRATVWYEDFCRDPAAALEGLRQQLRCLADCPVKRILPVERLPQQSALDEADLSSIREYIDRVGDRLAPHRYSSGPVSEGKQRSMMPVGEQKGWLQ